MSMKSKCNYKTFMTFFTSLGLICLFMTGCSSKSVDESLPSVTNNPTVVDESKEVEYNNTLVGIESAYDFSETGLTVVYNENELTFPFELDLLVSDGWELSSRTYDSDIDAQNDRTDAAIYTNPKYGSSELVVASYKVSGQPGMAGRQDVLKEHGVYTMSLHVDANLDEYPDLNICGLDIFSASESDILSVFSKSNYVDTSNYVINDVTYYSYVYDLGSYLVELNLISSEGQVRQCDFTTTIGVPSN